jgi:hypothetical protein
MLPIPLLVRPVERRTCVLGSGPKGTLQTSATFPAAAEIGQTGCLPWLGYIPGSDVRKIQDQTSIGLC